MAKVISIGTAVPQYKHAQEDILHFMQEIFNVNDDEKRKLRYLYNQSAINTRHSVLPDFGQPKEQREHMVAPFPSLDRRMEVYDKEALPLSLLAIDDCLGDKINATDITHLITVSCTGMSAPGLDLKIAEALNLVPTIFRTSINFMGCYAAIHGLKLAKLIVDGDEKAKVLIVCTELCTIHFQEDYTPDSVSSSMLFSDGCAVALVTNGEEGKGFELIAFNSEIDSKGKGDMSWKLSSKGFLMSLSSYVADIIKADILGLVQRGLSPNNLTVTDINHWCIHPGGRKILEAVEQSLSIHKPQLMDSYEVLGKYGNMSSPTILFVMKEMLAKANAGEHLFGCAFGPGLTMETLTAKFASKC